MNSEIADLEHDLDVALKVDFASLPPAVQEENLAALTRVRSKVEVLDHRVLMPFEASQQHRAQGHGSVVGWLEHNCRVKGEEAAGRRRLSRRLRHQPLAEEAMADGEITGRHVDVLERARRLVGDERYRYGEEVLVDAAVTKRFTDFVRTVDYFIARAAPEVGEGDEDDQIEQRWCSSSRTLDGCGKVDAWLPKLAFDTFDDELQRLAEHLYRQDVAEARERLGRTARPDELARTARQRRADALVLMARRSAAHGDAEVPESKFVVNLHAGAGIVLKILDRLITALRDGGDDEIDLDGLTLEADDLCEDDDGNVVTLDTLVLAILTGTVRGYLYDPDGVPLRFGRSRRLFTKAQADALRARHRRCCHPYGCDRTGARHLQSNHVTEYRHGGNTDVEDGDTQCPPHNRWHTNTYGTDPPDGAVDRDQRRLPPDFGPLDFSTIRLAPLRRPTMRRGYRWAA